MQKERVAITEQIKLISFIRGRELPLLDCELLPIFLKQLDKKIGLKDNKILMFFKITVKMYKKFINGVQVNIRRGTFFENFLHKHRAEMKI